MLEGRQYLLLLFLAVYLHHRIKFLPLPRENPTTRDIHISFSLLPTKYQPTCHLTATFSSDASLLPLLCQPANKTVLSIFTLRRKSTLANTGITHVLSVLKYDFKDFEDWEQYEHLSIEVDDVDDENLLGEFENSGAWIEKGLKDGKEGKPGKVLVHWYV